MSEGGLPCVNLCRWISVTYLCAAGRCADVESQCECRHHVALVLCHVIARLWHSVSAHLLLYLVGISAAVRAAALLPSSVHLQRLRHQEPRIDRSPLRVLAGTDFGRACRMSHIKAEFVFDKDRVFEIDLPAQGVFAQAAPSQTNVAALQGV
jgi:hypothetical protein